MPEQDRDFTITDKRSSAGQEETSPAQGEKPPAGTSAAQGAAEAARQQAAHEVTFSSFVLSLSTSAMIHMGDIADPLAGKQDRPEEPSKQEENLTAAKQIIDILGIIKEKTRGNLRSEEDVLLQDLLYQLRMRYLEKTGHIKP